MVFQNYTVWPHLTVGENVGFPLRMQGRSKKEIADGALDAMSAWCGA
jgi:ABC-type sugar transport system ATPase subunit